MQEEKRKKWIKWSWIIGLVVLIAFVIITSIVINYQRQRLKELQDANDQITGSLEDQESDEQDVTTENIGIENAVIILC